jgi:hypothetical protein
MPLKDLGGMGAEFVAAQETLEAQPQQSPQERHVAADVELHNGVEQLPTHQQRQPPAPALQQLEVRVDRPQMLLQVGIAVLA